MDAMELAERLHVFGKKVEERAPHVATEEATKAALIMPFLREILGLGGIPNAFHDEGVNTTKIGVVDFGKGFLVACEDPADQFPVSLLVGFGLQQLLGLRHLAHS